MNKSDKIQIGPWLYTACKHYPNVWFPNNSLMPCLIKRNDKWACYLDNFDTPEEAVKSALSGIIKDVESHKLSLSQKQSQYQELLDSIGE